MSTARAIARSLAAIVAVAVLFLLADLVGWYIAVLAMFGRQPAVLIGLLIVVAGLVFALAGITRAVTGRSGVGAALTVTALFLVLSAIGIMTGKLPPLLEDLAFWPHASVALLVAIALGLFLGPRACLINSWALSRDARCMSRFELLSDVQWSLIEELLPRPTRRKGRPFVDARRMVEAIAYR